MFGDHSERSLRPNRTRSGSRPPIRYVDSEDVRNNRESMRSLDLIGKKFGSLTVIRRDGSNRWGAAFWLCRCECGSLTSHRAFALTRLTKSCGCRRVKIVHGHCRRSGWSPEYRTWAKMKERCLNKKNKDYKHYGGRGIRICVRWLRSFSVFLRDVGKRPGPGYSIDRFPNNDGNYEPGNVRWATHSQQMRNRRPFKRKT